MRISKETNPEIIEILKDKFIEDGEYNKDVMAKEFADLMEFMPNSICVLVGYELDKIVGFIIAHEVDNRKFAYLAQAYSVMERNFAQIGVSMLEEWVKSHGLNEIRTEIERSSVQMIAVKRYGFKEHGVVMSRIL